MIDTVVMPFAGFGEPAKNFSELPHDLIAALPLFETLAELKVVLYILRHTWGYHEYDEPKRITLDEFEHGRKNRKGIRVDGGIGMARNSILNGLERATEHGFISTETNDSDKARIEKFYSLRMFKDCTSDVQQLHPGIPEIEHRTEKTTLETNQEIKKTLADQKTSADVKTDPPAEPLQIKTEPEPKREAQPDSVTVFEEALEPKEKGSGEKEKVIPVLPDGWTWLCSSVHGTLAHAVPAGKERQGRTACGAALEHRSPCNAPIGDKPFCLDCQRKAMPIEAKTKRPSINKPLLDAIAQHIEKIDPSMANGYTGVLAGKAGDVWKRKLNRDSLTAEDYASIARSIPVFMEWYRKECPGLPLRNKETFEGRYTQFV